MGSRAMKADYGLDAPGLVKFFLLLGIALVGVGVGLIVWRRNAIVIAIGFTLFFPGITFFIESLLMIWSSRVGKMAARDRLLDGSLRGAHDHPQCG